MWCTHPQLSDRGAFVDNVPDMTMEINNVMAEQRRMAVDFQGGSVCGDSLVIAGFHVSVDGTLGPTMYMPVGVTGTSLTPRWMNAMNFAHWLYNHAFRRMSVQHVRSLLGVLPTVIPGHLALLMRHDAADGADAHLLHSIGTRIVQSDSQGGSTTRAKEAQSVAVCSDVRVAQTTNAKGPRHAVVANPQVRVDKRSTVLAACWRECDQTFKRNEALVSLVPDPLDTTISKRQWEAQVQALRLCARHLASCSTLVNELDHDELPQLRLRELQTHLRLTRNHSASIGDSYDYQGGMTMDQDECSIDEQIMEEELESAILDDTQMDLDTMPASAIPAADLDAITRVSRPRY